MKNRAAVWSSARLLNRFLVLCLWLGAGQVAAADLGPETATVGLLELTPAEQRFIEQHPEVVLASGTSFEPFVIQDADGRISGHDVELARLISERTGLRIRFRVGLWEEMQRLAFDREVDGLATAINFENRQRSFDASRPYISASILVFVKHGNPLGIHGVEDLAGRRAAEQKGNLGFERLRQAISRDIEAVRFETFTEVLNAVANDRADFAIIDESAFYLIRELGLTRLIESAFVLDQTYEFNAMFDFLT
ncbi:transporter substrate-binding domain-containing protein [Allochromatium palmeri]|uniref:Transporter substrate-binding domain-containing protein n=1 Tax=Allochromatium palmeri TaxID=231048 RepID=A0A6N8EJD7_9GAMM|nr:transporter substrate-binding domain-containing protein [Allochromatium palmeri]MTW23138.1 transporter substrate-binding domain-containing protein [Allochromatium palmeri]